MSTLRFDQDLKYSVYPVYAPPPILIDGFFEGSLIEKQAHHGTENNSTKGSRPRVTIDMLPDVALLEIFSFYVDKAQTEAWHTLVHVCQKWRNIVFGSPRRLDLRLRCDARTPVREMLDVWPLFPIVVMGYHHKKWGVDNFIAALEHRDRICRLEMIDIPSSQFENVLATMHQPFPEMTCLSLQPRDETAPVDPDSFLGGSVPLLRALRLVRIPFPGLPKLLLSATHLVYLGLWKIPDSGYISPEAVVTALSVLTRLDGLFIGFESPRSRPDKETRRPPLLTRTLLPVLTRFSFKGVSEYLEDLVAQIDAPLLDTLKIMLFHQLIFDTPHLSQFIARTPRFKTLNGACVLFSNWGARVALQQTFEEALEVRTSCRQSDWQLSSLAEFCSSSFLQALIPAVEHLHILEDDEFRNSHWQDDIESSQWLELFHPFIALKDLYISSKFMSHVAPALQELVGERVTEVLPALQTLFLEDPFPSGLIQETIGKFVAARQLASHPLVVSRWDREEDESS